MWSIFYTSLECSPPQHHYQQGEDGRRDGIDLSHLCSDFGLWGPFVVRSRTRALPHEKTPCVRQLWLKGKCCTEMQTRLYALYDLYFFTSSSHFPKMYYPVNKQTTSMKNVLPFFVFIFSLQSLPTRSINRAIFLMRDFNSHTLALICFCVRQRIVKRIHFLFFPIMQLSERAINSLENVLHTPGRCFKR